jgi:hypothetical protein
MWIPRPSGPTPPPQPSPSMAVEMTTRAAVPSPTSLTIRQTATYSTCVIAYGGWRLHHHRWLTLWCCWASSMKESFKAMVDLYGIWIGVSDRGLGKYLSSVHKPSEYPSHFYSSTAFLPSTLLFLDISRTSKPP